MVKLQNGIADLFIATFVTLRILYYRNALKCRSVEDIILPLKEKRGSWRKRKGSTCDVLNKTHILCRKIQLGLLRAKRPCLVRALVLYEVGLRKGIDIQIVIGVKKNNNKLDGHAWIELAGLPYRENESVKHYTEMIRYPN